jgi:hypothetical protein
MIGALPKKIKLWVALLILGVVAWWGLSGRSIVVQSIHSMTFARIKLNSPLLVGLFKDTCPMVISRTNQVVGTADLLQTLFESPTALIPLTKDGTFLLVFDFDVENVLSVIDCNNPNDGKETPHPRLKWIYKSATIQIREPTLAEIDEAIGCLSNLSVYKQRQAIGYSLFLNRRLNVISNDIAEAREYYRPGGWRRGN